MPTTLEAGYPDSDYNFWTGILVPAKTPHAIIERLHAETEKAVRSPDVTAKLKSFGAEPWLMSTNDFAQHIKDELAANEKLVKAIGLTAN